MATASNRRLGPLLKEVSRSFYLTLRILPAQVRAQIGLAYLLARTTDTIADTNAATVGLRLEALEALRQEILGSAAKRLDWDALAAQQSNPAEKLLLEEHESSIELLNSLSAGDLIFVREVLAIIISGQELDLRRFADSSARNITALRTEEELDDYTYRVAGCVGEFWTRICRAHLFPNTTLDDKMLLEQSVLFGKGLQLVNILRDVAADLRLGRCYLPNVRLAEHGLAPVDLLDPANEIRFRPLYETFLNQARDNLMAGWAYTLSLPQRCIRVRLACAWPILIGLQTINRLRHENVLEAKRPIKISRKEVRKWMLRSVIYYPWSGQWRRLAQEAEKGQ